MKNDATDAALVDGVHDMAKSLKTIIQAAEEADCHVSNGSEYTQISGTAAQLAAAGYKGVFPERQDITTLVGYPNARGETVQRKWIDLYRWKLPLLETEKAPRLAEILAAEGPVDPRLITVGWFRKDRLILAADAARVIAAQPRNKVATAIATELARLLTDKEYKLDSLRKLLSPFAFRTLHGEVQS